jgi:glutaryl-CoA dehydrogenase
MTAHAQVGTPLRPLDLLDLDDELTPDELAVRERVASWAAERVAPRIAELFEQGIWDRALARELGDLGVLGMHLEGHGCPGGSAVQYGLACTELEAVDSGLRTFVSVQGSLAMTAIHTWGSDEQRDRWLPEMAAGEAIGCFGLTEPTAGSDPSSMLTTARREGGGWVLDGAKRWIGMGSIADVAVVWAKADDGVRGFLVERGTPGFTTEDITDKLSLRASLQSELRFDGVRLPDEAMLPGARGLRGPFSCLDQARYGIIWGVTGAARDCLDRALRYAREREQFGRPIAGFQLTQAKLTEMAVGLSRGQMLALRLGRLKDAGRLRPEHISIGKLDNVRMAQEVARTARTILGGEGVRAEHAIMRHMANLEAVATYEGTHEVHTLVIGAALTGQRAFT